MMPQPNPAPRESWASTAVKDVRSVVVVGGGPAAHRCVTELRRIGFDGSVTMVSAEPLPPYDRTLLSKDNLTDATAEIAVMAPEGTYESLGVEVLLGREATDVDAGARAIRLADGGVLHYDRLVLATGGAPILPRPFAAPGVLTMRTSADVAPVRDALERSRHIVVIGAGFIGGEIAAAAVRAGCGVTLIEACQVPLEPILGSQVGRLVGDLHVSQGVDLRCGVRAEGVLEAGGGYRVDLSDGSRLQCDSVIVGVGMRPSVGWLRPTGIEIGRAILTDAACRTSLPGVLAAGDCAQWWSGRYGEYCHVEHWDTAGKHGAAAARTVLGQDTVFDPVPFFWSDQYDVKYQWAGYAPTWDTVEIDGTGPTAFTASYLNQGRPVAVFVANQPKEFGRLRRALLAGPEKSTRDDKEINAS